ncbi:hypothetical protein NP075_18625 [Cellulomonas wangsupingiae]|uniref:Uncharacterized protein n=1 Tax=Cellulomonas wangsupingiae TaxID=2968085 RepID=A0ABY5K3R3_9CELL|nr:hypothetical protein [Cellulomonas wangsupingiae]UUI65097.1 hypothetical protein NP075_18625 [Cellulomonas wangsupingiae]
MRDDPEVGRCGKVPGRVVDEEHLAGTELQGIEHVVEGGRIWFGMADLGGIDGVVLELTLEQAGPDGRGEDARGARA